MNQIQMYMAAALMPVIGAVSASDANSAIIDQMTPTHFSYETELNELYTNDDANAIYSTGIISSFSQLDDELWDLPHNQSQYLSKWDMMQGWDIDIIASSSDVGKGWNYVLNTDGTIELSNIGGRPGLSFDQWLSTAVDPDQDMMAMTYRIPGQQTDTNLDGILDYSTGDAQIGLGDVVSDAFVGRDNNALTPDWPAQGFEYNVNVVPVPGTGALTLAGLGIIAAYNTSKQKYH